MADSVHAASPSVTTAGQSCCRTSGNRRNPARIKPTAPDRRGLKIPRFFFR
uniref:Uncharacterized protein n=1 Tax=Arundo donax TaxID=35708 RepID=A0A0A9B1D0_ARUDO